MLGLDKIKSRDLNGNEIGITIESVWYLEQRNTVYLESTLSPYAKSSERGGMNSQFAIYD